jgi:hypothetical protein
VETGELGKLFTMASVAPQIFYMIFSTLTNLLYEATLDTFPGAIFLLSASVQYCSCFLTLGLYFFVKRHERRFGPLGQQQIDNIELKVDLKDGGETEKEYGGFIFEENSFKLTEIQ